MADDFQKLAQSLIGPLWPWIADRLPLQVGTFIPTWVGTGTAGTFTYTIASTLVEWTRIGNRLFYNGRIVITAIGTPPTGNLTLAGFPFVGVSDASMAIAGAADVPFWTANLAAGYTQVGLQMNNGGVNMNVLKSGDNLAPAVVLASELIVGDWRFGGQYRVA